MRLDPVEVLKVLLPDFPKFGFSLVILFLLSDLELFSFHSIACLCLHRFL